MYIMLLCDKYNVIILSGWKIEGLKPILLHSEILINEISMKFCFLDILTKPKLCITHSSAILS